MLDEKEVRKLFDEYLEARASFGEAMSELDEFCRKAPKLDAAYYSIEKFNRDMLTLEQYLVGEDRLAEIVRNARNDLNDRRLQILDILPQDTWFVHGEWCFRVRHYSQGNDQFDCVPTEEISHELEIVKENKNV